MAEGVVRHLSASKAAIDVKDALNLAVASDLLFLDVAGAFSLEMMREFEKGLDLHIVDMKKSSSNHLGNPDLHQGYMSRLAELQEKLSAEIKDLD